MTGFRRLFRLSGREPGPAEDIAQEFEAHLQLKVDALVQSGLSPAEARKEAERSFGPLERFAAECRTIDRAERAERDRRERWSSIWQDLRLAARGLMRAPGFALTAALALGAGIGLNAMVFTVLQGVVLAPLPYPAADRLVAIYSSNPQAGWPTFSVSPTDFSDWVRETRSFDGLVAWDAYGVVATGNGPAEEVPVTFVTEGFGRVTGIPVGAGRGFRAPDFERGAPLVALLSYDTWSARFGRDPAVLGKVWTLDGERYEIVGVMPQGFEFPIGRTAAWLPFRMPADLAASRGAHYLSVTGRLAEGTTLAGASSELVTFADRIARTFPRSSAGWTVRLFPLHDDIVGDVRPTLLLLMTGAGLLLLLACANVANLVLVRAVGKSGEAAVRSALGASRGRLLWHGASEVLVLVLGGLLLALPIAQIGIRLIRNVAPEGVPRLETIGLSAPVLLFTFGVTALTALLVGLLPARRLARSSARGSLGGVGARSLTTRRGLHRWLVAVETAIALALLAVAGVLLKSKARLEAVPPGFDPASTFTAGVTLPDKTYPNGDAIARFHSALLEQLRAVPGVRSAALVFGLPLSGFRYSSSFTIDSVPVPDGVNQSAQLRVVSSDYFVTQGIPIQLGRGFSATDRRGSPPVVIINATAAKRFWPNGSPLGHQVRVAALPGPGDDRPEGVIVGVVGDVRSQRLDAEPLPVIYAHLEQVPVSGVSLAIRTSVAPLSLTNPVRGIVTGLDPEVPLTNVHSMHEVVRTATAGQRFRAWLMGLFAVLATSLAGLGVYGVISHIVAQRTREMGLRRALGASDHQVVSHVVRGGMRDAAIGAIAGLGLGWVISKQLIRLLYRVQPGDPVVLALSAGTFLAIAWLACWVPARRAMRADPVVVLRGE